MRWHTRLHTRSHFAGRLASHSVSAPLSPQVFEDMDVASDVMGKTMDSAQSASTPQDEVTMLMRQIGDEAGLDTANLLDAAGGVKQGALLPAKPQAAEVKAPEDDIEQRLAALRR